MKGSVVLFCVLAPTFGFACAPSGVCFRLSDCATGSVCTAGACVPVSSAGDAESAATDPDAEVSALPGDDASTSTDAPADGDASDETTSDGAADATDSAIADDGG
jgi:hypothetical protein